VWWYTPGKPVEISETTEVFEQPEWWYVPQDDKKLSALDFTTIDVAISLGGGQGLNGGAIPLDVRVVADGSTPEIVVQVVSEEVPDKAIYVSYEKTPEGAVQTLGGFQQARFVGGVGPDNVAEVQFKYESLAVGWITFEVQVWVGGNLIRGPENHSVYVSAVAPTFTSLDVTVSPGGSQGLNAGAIPLDIRVVADGSTPEIVVQVVSDEVPDKAVYVGYEKTPDGAVQTLGGFQQARFVGGVGPGNVAEVQFKYEPLTVGWINFTVQVWSEGNLLYGPERHWIYIREIGSWAATFPPLIKDFSIASWEPRRVTFNVDVSGNPDPHYELACGSDNAEAVIQDFSCLYHEPGKYTATLSVSNYVEKVKYSDVATTTVVVFDPVQFLYFPLVRHNH